MTANDKVVIIYWKFSQQYKPNSIIKQGQIRNVMWNMNMHMHLFYNMHSIKSISATKAKDTQYTLCCSSV